MKTYERVQAIIAQLTGEKPEDIGPGRTLGEQAKPNDCDPEGKCEPLLLDSLDLVNLAMMCEDEFHIQISDDEVDDPLHGHVGGLVAMVEDKLGETLELRQRA